MIWLLVVIVVVVVALCALGLLAMRRRRSAQLRAGFGPEYERTVREHGDRSAAEAELHERRERRRSYEIRSLDPDARERYAERWRATQAQFVDQPASALADADALVGEVMRERGYPVDDFERQAADISVDHPQVVDHYRKAHATFVASAEQRASTEDLRQAVVHYRALFGELLVPDESTQPQEVR